MAATVTYIREVVDPVSTRSAKNASGSTILARRIVRLVNTEVDAVALATAATQALYGVTGRTILNGEFGEVRVRGKVAVDVGAAVVRGDRLTANASGQAIPGASTNVMLGFA